MSGGLPLISSVSGELAAAIDEYRFGFNFEAGNSEQLAERILTLYNDRSLLSDMARNSIKFFEEHLDSESTYNNYSEHVENIANNKHMH